MPVAHALAAPAMPCPISTCCCLLPLGACLAAGGALWADEPSPLANAAAAQAPATAARAASYTRRTPTLL